MSKLKLYLFFLVFGTTATSGRGQSTFFFPHLASGANAALTVLVLSNSRDTAAQVRIRIFQPDGTPLALLFETEQETIGGSDFSLTLAPRSSTV